MAAGAAYALRNQAFADALADVNRDRVWTNSDQRSMLTRSAMVGALFLTALTFPAAQDGTDAIQMRHAPSRWL